jgi:23S rRNA pseudouridine1911/1915/1917 synthase
LNHSKHWSRKAVRRATGIRGDEHIQLSVGIRSFNGQAEPIPLNIVYEDKICSDDKPAGMVVHRGAGVRSGTLVNALLHHFEVLSGFGALIDPESHRLDKQTSAHRRCQKRLRHRRLSEQFQSGRSSKARSLVHGILGKMQVTSIAPLDVIGFAGSK